MKIIGAENKSPVVNAAVQIDSTQQPVFTDQLGWFEIRGEKKDSITLYIKHRKYGRVKIKKAFNSSFILLEKGDFAELGFWYPCKKFKDIEKHSSQIIKIDRKSISNPSNAALLLQHSVPGLTVSRAGNNPNQPFELYNRGMSSALGKSSSLIIVDGIPETSLERINPEDIDFFKITKSTVGAAAFGVLGSGGVIEVNTMEYDTSLPSIQYHTSIGLEKRQTGIPVMDADEYRQYKPQYDGGHSTNWMDEITQTAISNRHHLAFSKGGERSGVFASLGYQNENGVLKKSGFEQGNIRFNYKTKSKNGRKKTTIKSSLFQRNNRFSDPYVFQSVLYFNPTLPVYDGNGDFSTNLEGTPNPLKNLNEFTNLGRTREWSSMFKREVFLSPLKKISWSAGLRHRKHIFGKGNISFDEFDYVEISVYDKKHVLGGIKYNSQKKLKNILFKSEIGAEGSFLIDKVKDYFASGNIPNLTFKTLEKPTSFWDESEEWDSNKWNRTLSSAFVKNEFLWNIFSFSYGLRYDHIFIKNKEKGGLFGNARLAADLTQIIRFNQLDNIELSMGFGKTGLPFTENFSRDNYRWKFAGEQLTTSYYNPEEMIEHKTEIDAQLNISLFDGRLKGTVNAYHNYLYNQFLSNSVEGEFGNNGIEANLTFNNKPYSHEASWQINLGFFANKTAAYKFNNSGESQLVPQVLRSFNYSWLRLTPYSEISQYYGFRSNGIIVNGKYQLADLDGDGIFDQIELGSPLPKMGFTLTNQFSWKQWDATLKIRSIIGHKNYNRPREFGEFISERDWNIINTKYFNDELTDPSPRYLDIFFENASFLKLDYISIGYTPNLKKSSLRLYLAGHDLLTFTGYTGIDPEPRYHSEGIFLTSDPEMSNTYARTRRIVFGVQFNL